MGFEKPVQAFNEPGQSQEPRGPEILQPAKQTPETERPTERFEPFLKQEQFLLHEKSVAILGVAHVPETYERYQRELEEAVQKSSVVMLEAAPNAEGICSPGTIAFYREFQESLGITMSLTDAEHELRSDPVFKFFDSMEALAAKHGKDIVIADPMSTSEQGIINIYSRTMLHKKDDEVNKAKALLFGAGVLGMMAPHIADKLKRTVKTDEKTEQARGDKTQAENSKERSTVLNRRNFLKFIGGAAAAAAVGSEGASVLRTKGDYGGRGENPLGAMLYDSTDYRDVITAEGLERVARSPSYGESVAVICGEKHRAAIRHYAKSPRERSAKEMAYKPYLDTIMPRLRRFRYHQEHGWQQVNEEKL